MRPLQIFLISLISILVFSEKFTIEVDREEICGNLDKKSFKGRLVKVLKPNT